MRITLKDVARELNLSINTVSRGLRDMPDISPATRKLVKETAQRLGYQCNLAASQLRTKRSHIIGIIIPDYINPTMGKIIECAEFVARMNGYSLFDRYLFQDLAKTKLFLQSTHHNSETKE